MTEYNVMTLAGSQSKSQTANNSRQIVYRLEIISSILKFGPEKSTHKFLAEASAVLRKVIPYLFGYKKLNWSYVILL